VERLIERSAELYRNIKRYQRMLEKAYLAASKLISFRFLNEALCINP